MSRVLRVPKTHRYISEEAALRFLERLLLYVRTRRLSLQKLCDKARISRVTFYRWQKEKRIPAAQVLRISSLLGISAEAELLGKSRLDGPSELWRASLSPAEFGSEEGPYRNRQIVGFGVVWLLSRLSLIHHQAATELTRGDSSNPTARLTLQTSVGQPLAHVDLAMIGGQFLYQVFRHPPNGPPRKVFEGCADDTGLRLCLEYLRSFQDLPRTRTLRDFDRSLKNELNNYYSKHDPHHAHSLRRSRNSPARD